MNFGGQKVKKEIFFCPNIGVQNIFMLRFKWIQSWHLKNLYYNSTYQDCTLVVCRLKPIYHYYIVILYVYYCILNGMILILVNVIFKGDWINCYNDIKKVCAIRSNVMVNTTKLLRKSIITVIKQWMWNRIKHPFSYLCLYEPR